MRPRVTTSSSAASMRSRLIMTRSSGRIRLVLSAWRNSATDLPENSRVCVRREDVAVFLPVPFFFAPPLRPAPFFAELFLALLFFAELFLAELFLAELLRPELFFPASAIYVSLF